MALIIYCVEEYSYSVFVPCPSLEYTDEALKRTRINPYSVSNLKFFVRANEPILSHPCSDKTYYFVIDSNRAAAEADHILHASRVIDLMKLRTGNKVRKDVTGK